MHDVCGHKNIISPWRANCNPFIENPAVENRFEQKQENSIVVLIPHAIYFYNIPYRYPRGPFLHLKTTLSLKVFI